MVIGGNFERENKMSFGCRDKDDDVTFTCPTCDVQTDNSLEMLEHRNTHLLDGDDLVQYLEVWVDAVQNMASKGEVQIRSGNIIFNVEDGGELGFRLVIKFDRFQS